MKKKIEIFGESLLWVVAIWIGMFILYYIICAKQRDDHYKWHEYSDIRHFQSVLQNILDYYTTDERYWAIANTDEKMKAYRTIDEIIETELCFYNEAEGILQDPPYDYCLEKIFEGRKEYGKNSFERLPSDERFCFEEEVVRSLKSYIEPNENGRYLIDLQSKNFKDCLIWILIQGSYEEGYTVMILPDKKDPFSEVR